MKWVSVKDALPVIPKGKYAIQVLIAEFDPVFEEINPGKGYTVRQATYGYTKTKNGESISEFFSFAPKKDFMQLCYGEQTGVQWGPIFDEITHWMYLPEPPKQLSKKCEGCEAIGYCT